MNTQFKMLQGEFYAVKNCDESVLLTLMFEHGRYAIELIHGSYVSERRYTESKADAYEVYDMLVKKMDDMSDYYDEGQDCPGFLSTERVIKLFDKYVNNYTFEELRTIIPVF